MVSQRQWAISKCRKKKVDSSVRVRRAIVLDIPIELICLLRNKTKRARREIKCFMIGRRHVFESSFNYIVFSTQDSLRQFRFIPQDMGKIINLFSFEGKTVRRGYVCNDITAACILLSRISYSCQFYDLEGMFVMCSSKMSEIFWELAEQIYDNHRNLISPFRSSLMYGRATMYAQKIRAAGAMLPKCVGYIDMTKIEVCRPSGDNVLQQAVYSRHKRFHCLLFCTVASTDGLYVFVTDLSKAVDTICSY